MSRSEKLSALMEVWERQLFMVHGFHPREVDRKDHLRFLKRATDSQLESAIRAHGLDRTHGPVW